MYIVLPTTGSLNIHSSKTVEGDLYVAVRFVGVGESDVTFNTNITSLKTRDKVHLHDSINRAVIVDERL